jgi:hypothetical protein
MPEMTPRTLPDAAAVSPLSDDCGDITAYFADATRRVESRARALFESDWKSVEQGAFEAENRYNGRQVATEVDGRPTQAGTCQP